MSNGIMALFSLAMFVAGVVVIWVSAQNSKRTEQIEANGRTAQGTVTNLSSRYSRNGTSYIASYHAEIKNPNSSPVVIDKTERIGGSGYSSLMQNGPVSVVYLPEDPSGTAQLSSSYGGKGFWSGGAAGILLIGIALFGLMMGSGSPRTASHPTPANKFANFGANATGPDTNGEVGDSGSLGGANFQAIYPTLTAAFKPLSPSPTFAPTESGDSKQ